MKSAVHSSFYLSKMSNQLKRKLSMKSLEDKYHAIKDIENGISNKDAAAKYNVPKNTISTWLKNREKILEAFEGGSTAIAKKLRTSKHENSQKALLKWFTAARAHSIPVNGPILKAKAESYGVAMGEGDFKCSEGWLGLWKKRHNIKFKTISGEASSCTADMTSSWEDTTLLTILSKYDLEDIYNADEFGLFFKALPNKSRKTQQSQINWPSSS